MNPNSCTTHLHFQDLLAQAYADLLFLALHLLAFLLQLTFSVINFGLLLDEIAKLVVVLGPLPFPVLLVLLDGL